MLLTPEDYNELFNADDDTDVGSDEDDQPKTDDDPSHSFMQNFVLRSAAAVTIRKYNAAAIYHPRWNFDRRRIYAATDHINWKYAATDHANRKYAATDHANQKYAAKDHATANTRTYYLARIQKPDWKLPKFMSEGSLMFSKSNVSLTSTSPVESRERKVKERLTPNFNTSCVKKQRGLRGKRVTPHYDPAHMYCAILRHDWSA